MERRDKIFIVIWFITFFSTMPLIFNLGNPEYGIIFFVAILFIYNHLFRKKLDNKRKSKQNE
jgi:hypothetical protein